MCQHCWREAGSPTALPTNHEAFARLYALVYKASRVGGGLHVQLDDDNLEDGHVERPAFNEVDLTPDESECLTELGRMTEPERHASLAEVRGYRTETVEDPQ